MTSLKNIRRNSMRRIGVYGSLRCGMHNHCLLNNSNLIERKIVNVPYKMVSLGSFPALIPDVDNKCHDVVFEIYEVTDDVYANVEILEGYPDFYNKAFDADGKFEYYYVKDDNKYYQSRFEDEEHIVDWVEYMKH